MNRYEPSRPAPLVGPAAAAMSALVLALAVGVPAKLSGDERARSIAAARPHVEVAIVPSRIDVVGFRNDRTAANVVAAPVSTRAPNT
jgi:hypothetical protein